MTWRRAVVIGASGGIGGALAAALRGGGTEVVPLVRPTFDLTDEASVVAAAHDVGKGGPADLVIVASGILAPRDRTPEKGLRDVEPTAFAEVMAVNALGPLVAAKHFVPLLPREGSSAFVVLGARVGSITDNRLGGWYAYRASKAALAMVVKTLSIEVARTRPSAIVAALHPGTVATPLSAPFQRGGQASQMFTPKQSADALLSVIEQLTPAESGGHFAWDGSRIDP